MIPALTLREPNASLIMAGAKPFETRGFRPKSAKDGVFALHAGQSRDVALLRSQHVWGALGARFGVAHRYDQADAWEADLDQRLPRGVVLGLVRVVEVLTAEEVPTRQCRFGDFGPGRWAWRLEVVLECRPPIPAKGAQGFWSLPAQVDDLLVERIRDADVQRRLTRCRGARRG